MLKVKKLSNKHISKKIASKKSLNKKTSKRKTRKKNPINKFDDGNHHNGKKILNEIRYDHLDRIDEDGDIFYKYGTKTRNYLENISNEELADLKAYLDILSDIDLGGYRENDQQKLISRMVKYEINSRIMR